MTIEHLLDIMPPNGFAGECTSGWFLLKISPRQRSSSGATLSLFRINFSFVFKHFMLRRHFATSLFIHIRCVRKKNSFVSPASPGLSSTRKVAPCLTHSPTPTAAPSRTVTAAAAACSSCPAENNFVCFTTANASSRRAFRLRSAWSTAPRSTISGPSAARSSELSAILPPAD